MLVLVFVLFFSLISYVIIALIPNFFYWKKRGVCHVSLFTVLKRMMLMNEPYFDVVKRDYKKFIGKRYFGSYLSVTPALFVTDLDLIKQMFVKDFDHFTDRPDLLGSGSDPFFRKNLLSAKGKEWKELRTALSPAFTNTKMKAMSALIADEAVKYVQHFNQMDKDVIEVNVKDAYSKYTNDVIASCAFGVECDSLANPQNEMFLAGKGLIDIRPFKVVWVLAITLFPKMVRFLKVNLFPKEISHFFKRIITETIRTREKDGIVRPDIIHQLMEAKKGKLKGENKVQTEEIGFATEPETKKLQPTSTLTITDDIITAQAIFFFIAGYEASSSLLSCLTYELATHMDVQQKLIREIDEQSGNLSFEAVTKMKYLDQVVSEALRKYPTTFLFFRVCTKEYVIQPKEKDERPLKLKKGSLVIIPFIGTHYDDRYFKNPNAFIPERFSDENKKDIVPGSYTPFGVGPRNCIGGRFALLEIKTMVANILSKFEIHTTPKTDIPLKLLNSFPFYIDGGVRLALKKRKPTQIAA